MKLYDVRDVWMALRLAGKNLLWTVVLWFVASYLFNLWQWFFLGSSLLIVQSILIYFANRRYVIDLQNKSFSFPRSGMENSIFSILTFQPYWNLMRRKTTSYRVIASNYDASSLSLSRPWSCHFVYIAFSPQSHRLTMFPKYSLICSFAAPTSNLGIVTFIISCNL